MANAWVVRRNARKKRAFIFVDDASYANALENAIGAVADATGAPREEIAEQARKNDGQVVVDGGTSSRGRTVQWAITLETVRL